MFRIYSIYTDASTVSTLLKVGNTRLKSSQKFLCTCPSRIFEYGKKFSTENISAYTMNETYPPSFDQPSNLHARKMEAQFVKHEWRDCLRDRFGRQHNYLRISLTERCNLRCQYCMPAEGISLSAPHSILLPQEIIRFANLCSQAGVIKLRLTGGEPTIRQDFETIVRGLSEIKGISTFAMTTNGINLRKYLPLLKEVGLNSLNISLDTLIPAKYILISRRKGFDKVWHSIESVLAENFCQVKINCVVIKGFNDHEINDFVALTEKWPVHVRFIEFMPFDGNHWSDKRIFTKKEMLQTIRSDYPLLQKLSPTRNETASLYTIPGFNGCIGLISSMSDHFCSGCNRLRITADGNLKNCLFGVKEYLVRDLLRSSISDDEIMETLRLAMLEKAKNHGGLYN
ncbi:radical SAM domain-containing protein [Cardiosporidium cionae]|uniref:GTP 3',8-cyclase n=1 Tax=Cardiosporidium cionae TaxID=476202 RepID=A0ABQ7J5F3_9APIC|nr:radical SAM domain-containing protein [Cardiosporidium cionae]|eukprot:KAF8819245.1 radical SAM domain-containing protein [Cardiosporidium cionae]